MIKFLRYSDNYKYNTLDHLIDYDLPDRFEILKFAILLIVYGDHHNPF